MHSSINLFFFFFLIVLSFNPKYVCPLRPSSSSGTKLFDLRSLPRDHLTFWGDSHVQHKDIALTEESMTINAPRSAGVVLYKHPILFLDPRSRKVPSFCTMFAFSIQNIYGDKEAFGDGLTFLISPDDHVFRAPGYLALVESTNLTRNKFIAIEFDTKRDSIFQDPNDNHVGFDVNSLYSVKVATSDVNLKSGALISTWIEYNSNRKRVNVFLSESFVKPKKPLLKVDIDLSDYLNKNMFVGFSASTEGSIQMTRIAQWEFTVASSLPPPPPPFPSESGRIFTNLFQSGHSHSHLSKFSIGLGVGLCSIPFIALFGWFCWKKLMGMVQISEETDRLEMQPIRSSGGISCQDVQLFILARGRNIDKMVHNEAELIRLKTLKSSNIFLCNSLPAVKPSILPLSNSLPLRTNNITSV